MKLETMRDLMSVAMTQFVNHRCRRRPRDDAAIQRRHFSTTPPTVVHPALSFLASTLPRGSSDVTLADPGVILVESHRVQSGVTLTAVASVRMLVMTSLTFVSMNRVTWQKSIRPQSVNPSAN